MKILLKSVSFIMLSVLLHFIIAGTAAAYTPSTAGYTGISSYDGTAFYPYAMGAAHGVYAGGNYPHYYQASGSWIENRQNYMRVTRTNSMAYDNRHTTQGTSTYSRNYHTTPVRTGRFADPAYPHTYFWDRGMWNNVPANFYH